MDIGQISSRMDIRADLPSSPIASASALKEKVAAALTSSAIQQPDDATAQSQVGNALQSINKAMQALSSNLEFSVDADSNRTIVKVVDQQTKEVIRQMPSAEAVEISKALDKLQGLLVRQKA